MKARYGGRFAVVLVGVLLGLAASSTFGRSAPDAEAQCSQPPSSCLPGSGYTLNLAWNCGVLGSGRDCYHPGTRVVENASRHTWGWGSADYDGGGTTRVTIATADFGATGTNLARACYFASCNDQGSSWSVIWMQHVDSASHTIFGRGRA